MGAQRNDLLKDIGYSEKSIDFIKTEHNLGQLPVFTNQTSHVGECGDMLRLYLDIDKEGQRIRKASFELTGCAGLHACAAGLTTMLEDMPIAEAQKLDVENIIEFLGGLPNAKLDCAELARDTLRKALLDDSAQ